jgi:hypothetical protein
MNHNMNHNLNHNMNHDMNQYMNQKIVNKLNNKMSIFVFIILENLQIIIYKIQIFLNKNLKTLIKI